MFDKCRFTGNAGGGILIAPISIDSTTLPMDVTFNNCYVSNNGTNKYQISIYGYESGATGNIKFNNCMTDGGSYSVGGTKLASGSVSYTHLRAHETVLDLVCRLLLEKKN